MPTLKVSFVVQGEGRGHMTQALALSSILRDAGHEIIRVLVGRSPWRSVPAYFREGIGAPVEEFEAPTQVPGAEGRGLSVPRTVVDAARRSPAFVRSTRRIAEGSAGSDLVVNFLDLLGGVSRTLFSTDVPSVAVAHNYVFLHPALAGAPGPAMTRKAVLAYARATAAGSDSTLALSFDELPEAPGGTPTVVPPLLRPGLDALPVSDAGHLLAYALNPGYGRELAAWAATRPDVSVHCFLDGGDGALSGERPENLTVHPLGEQPFLEKLASCRAFVGSAGFESVCEAFFLRKPVLAVPTEGQFEQTLNAWDAERVGAAQPGSYSDLDTFWNGLSNDRADSVDVFRSWVARAPEIFVEEIERAAHRAPKSAEGRVP